MQLWDGTAGFWLAAALMIGLALAFVLPALVRRPRPGVGATRGAVNAGIYRAQLAELDEAVLAGELSRMEHRACADDIMRRALTDLVEDGLRYSAINRRWAAIGVALALPALATALYLSIGNPASLNSRDSLELAASGARLTLADLPKFAARLETHLAHTPGDGRAWVMLARANFELDRFEGAARAYERALAASRNVARDPQIWCELADALGMAQAGSLKGRPRELIARALSLNASHPRALEMAGSAEYEAGNFRRALAYWETLLATLSSGTQAYRELEIAVARVKELAASDGNRL